MIYSASFFIDFLFHLNLRNHHRLYHLTFLSLYLFPLLLFFPLFPSSVSSNSHYFFLHLVHYLLFVYLSVYLFICLSSFFLLPPSFHPLQGDKEGKAAQEQYIRQETGHPSFQSMISKFDDTFNIQLKEFLERLWTDSHRHHPMLR